MGNGHIGTPPLNRITGNVFSHVCHSVQGGEVGTTCPISLGGSGGSREAIQ